MKVYVVIRSASGENTNLGYNPSGDVLGAYSSYSKAKEKFDSQIEGELEFAEEEAIIKDDISDNEVMIINEDEDYCCSFKIEEVELDD